MPRRFRVLTLLAGLGLAIAIAGCGNPSSGQSSASGASYDPEEDPLVNPDSMFEPAPEDRSRIAEDRTLYANLEGSPNTLNPLFASSVYDQTVIGLLYDSLFTFDKDMEWRVNEEVVESFEVSDDRTTYTATLKPGLTWHDGEPFTAEDVVYSWKQILDERVPAVTYKTSTSTIEQVEALDERTVRFVQPEGYATAEWDITFPIIPKHIFEQQKEQYPDLQTGQYYSQQARHPVGWGPYRIVEWEANNQIVLERWEDYHGEKPHFERIVFRIIPDTNTALLSFEQERVEVIRQLNPQQFALETTQSEAFKRVGYKGWGPQWSFSYIGWNMDGSNPFFDDVRVRRAMTHALNIPRIIEKVYYNLAEKSHGIYHPDSWMYNDEVEPLEYDLEKAAALLDEAGWEVDPNTGWRHKQIDGQRVPFEFTLLIPQGSDTSPKIATIFQQDLQSIGVRMETRTLEWASFLEKVRNHDFEAEIAGWGTGTDPDTGRNLWMSDQYDDGRNYGGYSNERVDELFNRGREVADREERAEIYQEIHKILYEDQPYTWIVNPPILAAFNKRIQGVQFSPRGIYGFDPGVTGWWVANGGGGNVAMQP